MRDPLSHSPLIIGMRAQYDEIATIEVLMEAEGPRPHNSWVMIPVIADISIFVL
jgi:hypothetical protein